MRFSERMGFVAPKILQVEGLDDDLRNSLWNAVRIFCLKTDEFQSNDYISKIIWIHFFKKAVDEFDDEYFDFYSYVYKWFQKCDWRLVYEFIEYIISREKFVKNRDNFIVVLNDILEMEASGYRLSDLKFIRITNELERAEIDQAVSYKEKYGHVSAHVTKAVRLLSDRNKPDYENAIKESISAVEAMCREILGNQSATLGEAVRALEKSHDIHPAFRDAVSKLYGYTNDRSGVRHASKGRHEADFAEAKFMVVTCSAIINFLIQKHSKKVDLE